MANLKEVRTRIESVNSTRQITSAMKMVAASKLRKAQNSITTMRPYAAKLRELLQNLSGSLANTGQDKLTVVRPEENILIVPVTSNRGLCGAFNANVIRYTVKLIAEKYAEQQQKGQLSLLCIGKKGEEFFRGRGYQFIGSETHIFDTLDFDHVSPIAEQLIRQFEEARFDKIIFVYNQFRNAGSQVLTEEQFLPIALPESNIEDNWNQTQYIFEPDKQSIIEVLVPRILKMQVYKMLLDSFAAEHGARMIAMHKATDNATEMLKELKLSYNKARQAAITKEILEIVGGANALG
ncbi:MAG: ATP synthase F1 subunit gamma [Bacteroidales bacterium]|nr:ATP synthase F1 subunit gamma [Bacteroidales bacterium]